MIWRKPSLSDVRARLFRTAGWLLVRQVVTMFNALVLGVLIARHLGPEQFGILNYAISLTVMALPLTTLGLRNLALREYSRHPDATDRILGTVTVMRLAGTVVAIAAMAFVVTAYPVDHENIRILVLLLGGALLFQTIDTIKEQFISQQNPRAFVIINVLVLLCFSLLRVGLILADATVDAFILVQAAETVMQALAAGFAYVRYSGKPPRMRVDFSLMRRYAANTLPLMLGSISTVIYLKVDILFLSQMVGAETTGHYAVAARLSEAWYMVPSTLAMAMFPRMVQLREESPDRYASRMQDAMGLFALFGLLVSVTSLLWAGPVVDLLFGAAYAPAVALLQIQVWVGVVFASRQLTHKWLLAEGHYWGSALIHLTGAVSNVILNLILIPIYGAPGAAFATVISYTTSAIVLAPFVPSIRAVAAMQMRSFGWPVLAVKRVADSRLDAWRRRRAAG